MRFLRRGAEEDAANGGAEAVGAGIPFGMRKEIRPGSLVCPSEGVCTESAIRRDRNSDDAPR